MNWFIGFLTVVLILDCLLLILLVLIQLPKKEAGMGQAFGGAATDALFGAGSGNALTKLTKYSAGIFFGLALSLSVLNAYAVKHSQSRLSEITQQQAAKMAQEQQADLAARAALSNKNAAPVVAPAPTNSGSLLIAPPPAAPAPAPAAK